MFRAIPVSNRNCGQFQNEQNRKTHQRKLLEMKHLIDTRPPGTFGLANSRKKKEQLIEDRFTEIERENRILLEKITQIMQKSHGSNFFNRRKAEIKKPSLNKDVRKRDLVKIAIENQEILKRIENKRSSYNIKTWQKNREASEKYLQNISEYPLILGGSSEFERQQIKTADLGSSKRTKLPSLNRENEERSKPATSLNKNRKIIIYKKAREILDRRFLLEIYIEKQTFTIIAEDIEQPFVNFLEIPEVEAIDFLRKRYRSSIENLIMDIQEDENGLTLGDSMYVFQRRKPNSIEKLSRSETPAKKIMISPIDHEEEKASESPKERVVAGQEESGPGTTKERGESEERNQAETL